MTEVAESVAVVDLEGVLVARAWLREVLDPASGANVRRALVERQDEEDVVALLERLRPALELSDFAPAEDVVLAIEARLAADASVPLTAELKELAVADGMAREELVVEMPGDVRAGLAALVQAHSAVHTLSDWSEGVQGLVLAYAQGGDLRADMASHLWTAPVPIEEAATWTKLAELLGADPARSLYVSDHDERLLAAQAAGWRVVRVLREGYRPDNPGYPVVNTLTAAAEA